MCESRKRQDLKYHGEKCCVGVVEGPKDTRLLLPDDLKDIYQLFSSIPTVTLFFSRYAEEALRCVHIIRLTHVKVFPLLRIN